ncbi:MAG: hypothetical protein NZM35_04615 [Chitinophagales bacterium]|nr:hypothetical protein [Chitinophagales bacterium]MDW8418819.1 hypothetical protein [Chitinophagales bacterium]
MIKFCNILHHAVCTVWIIGLQFCYALPLAAQRDSTYKRPDYYIDDEQVRIDKLDGVIDKKVQTGDSVNDIISNYTYFGLIDSLQEHITLGKFTDQQRKTFRDNLYLILRRINQNNFYNAKRYEALLKFIREELIAIEHGTLLLLISRNIVWSFQTFSFFKNEPEAEQFLLMACRQRPDLVFKYYDQFYHKTYARRILEEGCRVAPVTMKKYFNAGQGIYETLKTSSDTVVKMLLQIRSEYTLKSNAYTLIHDIANGKLTIHEADAIGQDPRKYLERMLRIRAEPNPLGAYSLDAELEVYALRFVRVLNDLHNEPDEKRFASIEEFTAPELYTLMVYSTEEIFTSSFNGLFNRLMVKLGPVSGYEFLHSVGFNRFRTFIKMAAGYGKLGAFLQSMTPHHQQRLMLDFAGGLEQYNDLSQAVEVADAFGSITDTLVLKILRSAIKIEYLKMKKTGNDRGAAIYGLLSSLFVDKTVQDADWFSSVSSRYTLPDFTKIAHHKLVNRDSISRWMIYFYDDEDGEASFSSFIKTFTDTGWSIVDSGTYVVIRSRTGHPVQIYANKNKNEYDGQEALEKLFNDNGWMPNVMVHRGHSYYAYKTIERVRENTQVFILGSCGGYHSISSVIEQSPEVSIISSKQIGTMFVNNPMLKLIANTLRKGEPLEWQLLWNELGNEVRPNAKAYERFLDYIPPHKNLGAIFIKAYQRIFENR